MKKNLLSLSAVIVLAIAVSFSSCKKGIKDPVTLDKAAGKWSINAIRYQVFAGGSSNPQDSTVPWRPNPENYVTFDGTSTFRYAFNNSGTISGQYAFVGSDSMSITMDGATSRWKILLLTPTNFNIEQTSDNVHDFPGATVITYQSFVR